MASLLQPDRVEYLVRGEKKIRAPLSQLYFCRYCSELRSLECVSHEVDSHYCPSCLESMPSAEAKLKKNRCANCFDCPCCMHTLSTRATNIPAPMPDDPTKTTMKKAYYLACGFCRWTSRDVGMADKSVASGGWQEPENPHTQRINKLIEYYQQLAQREKLERDRKKLARRRPFMPQAFSQHTIHVVEKYGLGTRLQRQRSGAPISALYGLSLKEGEEQKEVSIEPAQALDEVEPLPEDYYTRPVNLTEVTTLRQRLLQPDFQPAGASQLHPKHKHLLMKRSLRCRKCEHNLSKPEFNPTSIKFKIQLVAVSYIPEVRIMSIPNLRHMKESQVLLTLTNPVESVTHVSLFTCEEEDPDDINSTAKVLVPAKELVLAGKDAAAEYDELAEPQDFQDDPDVVAFRKSNKIGFFIKVIPQNEDGDVTVSLKMRHDFRNLAAPIRPSEEGEPAVELIWLTHHVELSLGPLAA
ncbi:dynactin subunit 4 isoform X1 [Silurus meridionalis]|uniref:dynactin subunit 4 isoform X1 n=1 Tax=Silurus meridionalis TaxID=175797 RepID=UPI001EEAC711|nr:dynactin subunit 4 isoform X1 [Silurus meridionalis]XP_046716140.1 dynactin subunit 4 isoform X1 [Silurus meridionalis]KAI5100842.1 dynactin subunit 4 isoform 1 [Silurus meridionalis]